MSDNAKTPQYDDELMEQYLILPGAVFEKALGLTSSQLLVIVALLTHRRKRGQHVHPSYDRIAKMVNLSPHTVGTVAKQLDALGLVPRVRLGEVWSHNLEPLLEKLKAAPEKSFARRKRYETDKGALEAKIQELEAKLAAAGGPSPESAPPTSPTPPPTDDWTPLRQKVAELIGQSTPALKILYALPAEKLSRYLEGSLNVGHAASQLAEHCQRGAAQTAPATAPAVPSPTQRLENDRFPAQTNAEFMATFGVGKV